MPASSGKAQSSSSIITPLKRRLRLVDRQLEELEDDGLVLAEHFAGGDAEEEGVADLAGGAGDGDADGWFHNVDSGRKGDDEADGRALSRRNTDRASAQRRGPRAERARRDAAL